MTTRIAFARIAQETNALSPVRDRARRLRARTTSTATRCCDAVDARPRGARLLPPRRARRLLRRGARGRRVEPVPVLSAWASSGGPLSRACFEALEARLVDGIRAAGRVDARLPLRCTARWASHGVRDPETRLLARRARRCSAACRSSSSHDLHGNVTRARIAACDALVAYHTNPHRDHARTGAKRRRDRDRHSRAARRGRTIAWRSLPMLLGGGKTIDFLAPMRAVFRRMRRAERRGEVLAASTFMVHPWNDDPALGWSTVVVERDAARAERARRRARRDVLGSAATRSRRRSRARARRSRGRARRGGGASSAA